MPGFWRWRCRCRWSQLPSSRPRPACLGVEAQPLDGDLADSLNLAVPNGSLVTAVAPNVRALYRAILYRPFGSAVVIDLLRNGVTIHVPTTLVEFPDSLSLGGRATAAPGHPVPKLSANLGLSLGRLTDSAPRRGENGPTRHRRGGAGSRRGQ